MWVLGVGWVVFFVFKQKTAYEVRISDWGSDVCSSDLADPEFDADRLRADRRLRAYNITGADRPERRDDILRELLGSLGAGAVLDRNTGVSGKRLSVLVESMGLRLI